MNFDKEFEGLGAHETQHVFRELEAHMNKYQETKKMWESGKIQFYFFITSKNLELVRVAVCSALEFKSQSKVWGWQDYLDPENNSLHKQKVKIIHNEIE